MQKQNLTAETKARGRKVNGYVIYDGPSLIDGQRIVVVAILKTGNRKTGSMLQTYIIRPDIDPRAANKSGADFSICGHCPHRGAPTDDPAATLAVGRLCYVRLDQGTLQVFKALQNGNYPKACAQFDRAAIGAGRMVRLGTYGDPAAVPSHVWDALLGAAAGHTAYTHQSGIQTADVRHDLFMTSADSLTEASAAWAAGRRTFRVIASVTERVREREILCPASEEAGRTRQCADCRLCNGARPGVKSVAIVAHGAGRKHHKAA